MKQKLMTQPQSLQLRKVAVDKGFTAELTQKKLQPLWPQLLDALMKDVPITIGIPLVPPPGGRIITFKAKVNLDQEWQSAVNDAEPNTPASYNVRKVGDLYPTTGVGVVEEEFIALNYPNGDGSWDRALAWAQMFNLSRTVPREVFGVGASHPNFNREHGLNPCYIVATTECAFGGGRQACCVWWSGADRGASLRWVEGFGGRGGWFLFRKP